MTEKNKKSVEILKKTENNICQSCGMHMKNEDEHGTNANGSKNKDYCHYCYQDGKFTDEGITMEGKIKEIVDIAEEMGMCEKEALAKAKKVLPDLKRWKK